MDAVLDDLRALRPRLEQSRSNFQSAARSGLNAQLVWLDGESMPRCQNARRKEIDSS